MAYKKMTSQERTQRRREQVETMQNEIETALAALTSPEDWKNMLNTVLRIRTYSLNNLLLITEQCAARGFEPSVIMGMKGEAVLDSEGEPVRNEHGTREVKRPGWNAYGRGVEPGQKAIWVLAPVIKPKDPNDPDSEKQLVGWMRLPVFDISQTKGEPFPIPSDFVHRLEGDGPEKLKQALEDTIRDRHGYSLQYEAIPGEANGYTTPPDQARVVIDDGLSGAQTIKTLAHELAHIELRHFERYTDYGNPGTRDRELAEVEAESVSYMLCREAGIDPGEYSIGYVASWSKGEVSVVAEVGKSVRTAAFDLMEDPRLTHVLRGTEPEIEEELEPVIEPTPTVEQRPRRKRMGF